MGDYFANPVQHPEDTGIAYLRRTIRWNSPGFPATASVAGSYIIGAIPPGAMVIGVDVNIDTAFDATTTNLVDIGIVGTLAGYAAAASTLVGSTGFKPNLQSTLSGIPASASQVILATYTFTGAVPANGKGEVVVKFVPKREGTGTTFPNN